ncbi:MAG TPA: hypothetical protein VF688_15260 [Allosphingosinicella sp.]|jgi:hypothetical protein
MQGTIGDALIVIAACLLVAAVAIAVVVFRPSTRRHRHRKRHSRRPKIDLFTDKAESPTPIVDA